MTLIVDAGPLIALADQADPVGPLVQEALSREAGELIIPAPVTAEVDYLLDQRLGRRARFQFLQDLANGLFAVACPTQEEYSLALACDRQYADLNLGLADLSVIVLANRYGTNRILTFDHRHFRAARPLSGGSFTLLPEPR